MKCNKPLTALLLCLMQPAAWAAHSMHAMVLNDGKLQLQSLPIPEPQSGQVRIRVRAASVNPVDWKLAQRAAPGTHSISRSTWPACVERGGCRCWGGLFVAGQARIAVAVRLKSLLPNMPWPQSMPWR